MDTPDFKEKAAALIRPWVGQKLYAAEDSVFEVERRVAAVMREIYEACVQAHEESSQEEAQLRERLSELLTQIAFALKGPPPERTLHDWSDLPELAATLSARVKALGGVLGERPEPSVPVSKLRATCDYWEDRMAAPTHALKQLVFDVRRDCDEAERETGDER